MLGKEKQFGDGYLDTGRVEACVEGGTRLTGDDGAYI